MANRRYIDGNYIDLLRQASGECWSLFKAYIGIEKNDDESFKELYNYSQKLFNKYRGTEAEFYVRKYVGLINDEIERVSKKG